MKRVLVVNTAPLGFTGITSIIMNYVRKTHKRINYDFVLCSRVEKCFVDELKSLGANVFIPPCSRVKRPLAYSAWLKKLIKENGYDCIHVHGNSGTMFFEIHAAKSVGVRVRIAHSHSTSCKHMLAHRVLKPLLNRELTYAIACSDMAGNWLFNREFTILYNGIDIDKFAFSQEKRDEYRRSLHFENKYVIGHIGYMDSEKNHIYLLEVFRKYMEINPSAHLLLIGDGRLRNDIENYIADNNMSDRVSVLGKRSDAAELYQCMDIFVLPSLFEGLPVTLVEAQTAGLHCLVSNRVTEEVNITGNISYLEIGDDSKDIWIQALEAERKNITKRDECKALAIKSKFNIENCIEELLALYHC